MMASQASKRQQLLSVFAGGIGVIVLFYASSAAYDLGKSLRGDLFIAVPNTAQGKDLQVLNAELERLRKELNETRQTITAPIAGNERMQFARQLRQTVNDVRGLQVKQERIEQAILANPVKALEIPLIQRDIEAIKATQQSTTTVLKESIDRVYDLNKWLLGGMAVSVITLALSNLLRARAKPGSD